MTPSHLNSMATAGVTSASAWAILGCISGAGAIGGTINALLSNNELTMPTEKAGILQPSLLGDALVGAFGAVITWGLYGPLKDAVLLGAPPIGELPANLSAAALVEAVLTGTGGARVVTAEIDKRYLRSAGASAAVTSPDTALATTLRTASPASAAEAALEKLQSSPDAPGTPSPSA